MKNSNLKDRMLGCLFGQAIGDALGLGSEFMDKNGVIKHYPDGLRYYSQIIKDVHRSRWAKGSWTDDTDMMLCILDGFENGKFNVRRVASNFKDWFNGDPLGIGKHTNNVLCMGDYVEQPEMCSKLWWNISRQKSAANGALMRTSVVGLATSDIEEQAIAICKLTHYDPRCVGSCVIVSSIIHALVFDDRILDNEEVIGIAKQYDERIVPFVDLAYHEGLDSLCLDDEKSMGYTLRTLGAALWAYWHATSYKEGILKIVLSGGDADTNAAVAGAILGAKFGICHIPDEWRNGLLYAFMLYNKVQEFYAMYQ